MNEYINKTKFLEQLRQELSKIDTVHHDHIDLEKQIYKFAIKKVEEMESEDVESIKHGRWLINSDGYYPYCSECNEEPTMRIMSKFCPSCGAKMDKE